MNCVGSDSTEGATGNHTGKEVDINGEENIQEYRPGGYHPVNPGDILGGRYLVKSKLGWGSFSTVWMCEDQEEGCSGVAVKVVQSEKIVTAMAKDEVTLLLKAKERGKKESHLGSQHIVQLLSNFEQWGPNGKHQCLALEVLGPNLLSCIQQNHRGLSMNKVKEVMFQVMQGLDFLHSSAGIIHTDVKPENILLAKSGQQDFFAEGPPIKVKIADLGGACWINERFSVEIGTRQYRAPEVLVGVRDYGPGVDVWAAGCTAFELATGRFLFQPKVHQKWGKDEDHLRLVTQTVGHLPKEVIEAGTKARKFYSGERLKKVVEDNVQATSIVKQLLLRKTWFQFSDLQDFSSWLQLLLAPDPKARATAYQSAKHSFLEPGRGKKTEEDVDRVDEVEVLIARTAGIVETAGDDPPECPKGNLLFEKELSKHKEELLNQKEKLVQLESKLEKVVNILLEMKEKVEKQETEKSQDMVKLLVEMKEKVRKQDADKTEELAKLKEKQGKLEEAMVQQAAQISRLKGESPGSQILASSRVRSGNLAKHIEENSCQLFTLFRNQWEVEEVHQVNTEENGKDLGQMGIAGSGECRPDFRHNHSTLKAQKINWGAGSSRAGQTQSKLASPKVLSKNEVGGDKVQLKRRQIMGDLAEVLEPKKTKRASLKMGSLGVGFKVANQDSNFAASQVVCGAGKKHNAKACGKCEGCLRKSCGLCKYCLDKTCFGGSNLLKQKCQERACTNPQRAKCEACL